MPSPSRKVAVIPREADELILLTPAQVMTILQIRSTKLEALMSSGELRSFKIGKYSRRIPKSAVSEFIFRAANAEKSKSQEI